MNNTEVPFSNCSCFSNKPQKAFIFRSELGWQPSIFENHLNGQSWPAKVWVFQPKNNIDISSPFCLLTTLSQKTDSLFRWGLHQSIFPSFNPYLKWCHWFLLMKGQGGRQSSQLTSLPLFATAYLSWLMGSSSTGQESSANLLGEE